MKKLLLTVAAVTEILTGLIVLVSPSIVTHLLFGAEVAGAGAAMSRVLGISLIALGVACWPNDASERDLYGMLTYSTLVALYLVYVASGGGWTGVLLWSAFALHASLSALLARAWVQRKKTLDSREKIVRADAK